MDFEKLLAKADSNAKKQSKKVVEANFEMETDRRRKLERLKLEKQLEKEELKRKLPPAPPKPKPKEFVIPKKNEVKKADVDKESIAKFFQKKEDEKRRAEIQKKREKEELIRLRLEANGGKANKKISKHFGISPIALQANYSQNHEHLDSLIKRNEREQEEHDRLSSLYRTGVYKAVQNKNQVVATTKKPEINPNRITTTTNGHASGDSKYSSTSKNGSSSLNNSKSQISSSNSSTTKNSSSKSQETAALKLSERKRLPPQAPVDDFYTLMAKAEQNRKMDPKKLEAEILAPPPPKKVVKIETSVPEIGLSAGKTLNYCGMRALAKKDRDERDNPETIQKQKQIIKEKLAKLEQPSSSSKQQQQNSNRTSISNKITLKSNFDDRHKSNSQNTSKLTNGLKNDTKNGLPTPPPPPTTTIKTIVVDPEMGVVKRYLPGDVRYKASIEASTSKPQQQLNISTSFKQLNNYNNTNSSTSTLGSAKQILKQNSQLKHLEKKENSSRKIRTNEYASLGRNVVGGGGGGGGVSSSNNIDMEKAALEKRLRQMEEEHARNLREKEELLKELKRKKETNNNNNSSTTTKTKSIGSRGSAGGGGRVPEENLDRIRMEERKKEKIRKELNERQRRDEMERRRRAAKVMGHGRYSDRSQQHRPSTSSNRLINFSESDDEEDSDLDLRRQRRFCHDDDDDDDDEGEDEDEYDSEFDDFIDDSIEDGTVSREMLEESLKAVNQRYDRKKYAMIDKMPGRCMTARFSDIEKEERRSAKLAYLDDLREAERGSRALK